MDASTLRLIFLVGTIGLIFAALWWDRKNVERMGILFLRRTKKGINLIDRIAKRFPRFWNVYAWTGVVSGVLSIFLMVGLVGEMVFGVLSTGEPSSGAGLVLPGTGSTVSTSPGVTTVPAEYWFISIAILMFVHELSHGIVARLEDFEINSVGVLVLGVIPGAFVEPKGDGIMGEGDEDDEDGLHGAWDQGDWISRIKVLCAGSFANYIVAAIFIVLATLASSAVYNPGNIYYTAQDGFPAKEAGMNQGKIISFNGSQVKNFSTFAERARNVKVNETVSFETTEGSFDVIATSSNQDSSGYLGIRFSVFSPFQNWFIMLLQVIGLLNLGIGMFNMLPAKPLDGGHVVDAAVEHYFGEEYGKYVNYWSLLVGIALIGVIVFSILA